MLEDTELISCYVKCAVGKTALLTWHVNPSPDLEYINPLQKSLMGVPEASHSEDDTVQKASRIPQSLKQSNVSKLHLLQGCTTQQLLEEAVSAQGPGGFSASQRWPGISSTQSRKPGLAEP